jgi:hypothetical protein
MVVTAKPFATRDEMPSTLEAKMQDLEGSEMIDPSLEAVSRPHWGKDSTMVRRVGGGSLTRLKVFLWK